MKLIPLVSVIIPVFNREKYIAEAINSVLNQTLQDFEIIIIDDCSTDDTRKILESYSDPRIRICLEKENKGVAAVTNKGFKLSKGRYIARMDSDDIIVPGRLSKQVSIMNDNPSIGVCGSWIQIMNSNKILRFKEFHDEILCHLLLSCSISIGTAMFRKEVLDKYELDENLRFGEDYEFWSRICLHEKFYNIQEPLLHYRVHSDQISGINKQRQLLIDRDIRLGLFRKLEFPEEKFGKNLLEKVLLKKGNLTLTEYQLVLEWFKTLKKKNVMNKIFPHQEFLNVLKELRQQFIFSLYFQNIYDGVDRRWRIRALKKLSFRDLKFLIPQKIKEYLK